MSKNIFSNEAFAEWCEQQGDKKYNYYGNYLYPYQQRCAIHQYLISKGVNVKSVTAHHWYDENNISHNLPKDWALPACQHPWNFKDLAKRLQ